MGIMVFLFREIGERDKICYNLWKKLQEFRGKIHLFDRKLVDMNNFVYLIIKDI